MKYDVYVCVYVVIYMYACAHICIHTCTNVYTVYIHIYLYRVFLKINKFIYLFMAALGLRCCVWAFSSCSEWGLLFVVVCGLLIAVASLVAEHRL